jgi:hypothetical protein
LVFLILIFKQTMKMESNFLDEGCDVFMNESEIKNKVKT